MERPRDWNSENNNWMNLHNFEFSEELYQPLSIDSLAQLRDYITFQLSLRVWTRFKEYLMDLIKDKKLSEEEAESLSLEVQQLINSKDFFNMQKKMDNTIWERLMDEVPGFGQLCDQESFYDVLYKEDIYQDYVREIQIFLYNVVSYLIAHEFLLKFDRIKSKEIFNQSLDEIRDKLLEIFDQEFSLMFDRSVEDKGKLKTKETIPFELSDNKKQIERIIQIIQENFKRKFKQTPKVICSSGFLIELVRKLKLEENISWIDRDFFSSWSLKYNFSDWQTSIQFRYFSSSADELHKKIEELGEDYELITIQINHNDKKDSKQKIKVLVSDSLANIFKDNFEHFTEFADLAYKDKKQKEHQIEPENLIFWSDEWLYAETWFAAWTRTHEYNRWKK